MGTTRVAPIRYEYRTETSQKFWEGSVNDAALIVRFGKNGTVGQTHTTRCPTVGVARYKLVQRTRERIAQGYKPTEYDRPHYYDAPSVNRPTVVTIERVGEHIPVFVLVDLCAWLTACIRSGLTVRQFIRVWKRCMKGAGDIAQSLGHSRADDAKDIANVFWEDCFQEGDVTGLYRRAIAKGADRFIWFNDNATIVIVACRGDPGVRTLYRSVLGDENRLDEQGRWLTEWPATLGPGAPILFVHETTPASCMLRDKTRVLELEGRP